MKQVLAQFWQKYPALSHAVAGVLVLGIEAYSEVPQFHDAVQNVLHAHPHFAGLVAVAVALYGWYKQHRKEWTPEQRAQLTGSGK